MDTQKAKYFLSLTESGTVTAAAERLGITQPALSRQLRRFEKELGLQLFDRVGTTLQLNDAAHALIPICRQLVAEDARAGQAVASLRRGSVRALTIAATPTTISTLIAPFIAAAGESIPLVTTIPMEHYGVYEALGGEADMVVAPVPATSAVAALDLGEAPVRAWMLPTHPLAASAQDGVVEATRLVGERLALTSTKSVSRARFDSFLASSRARTGELVECDDTGTLVALARAGRAVAVCSDLQPEGLVGFGIVNQAGSRMRGVPLVAGWREGHYAKEEIRALAVRLRDFIAGAVRA